MITFYSSSSYGKDYSTYLEMTPTEDGYPFFKLQFYMEGRKLIVDPPLVAHVRIWEEALAGDHVVEFLGDYELKIDQDGERLSVRLERDCEPAFTALFEMDEVQYELEHCHDV